MVSPMENGGGCPPYPPGSLTGKIGPPLAEDELLNFPGGGLGELVNELKTVGNFEVGQVPPAETTEGFLIRHCPGFENDKSKGSLPPFLSFPPPTTVWHW